MTIAPFQQRKRATTFTHMRKVANFLVLVGYYVDMTTGITIRVVSALLVLPWMIDNKVWDGAFVMSIMLTIDAHKLLSLLIV